MTVTQTGQPDMRRMAKPDSIIGPVEIQRIDQEGGGITYEIWDRGQWHMLCVISDDFNGNAKAEADFIALAINAAIGAFIAASKSQSAT